MLTKDVKKELVTFGHPILDYIGNRCVNPMISLRFSKNFG